MVIIMSEDKLADGYFAFHRAAYEPGKLDKKTKELMALAVAAALRCEKCIDSHSQKARVAGATPEEMKEAVYVSASVCAGAALTYGSKTWKEEKKE